MFAIFFLALAIMMYRSEKRDIEFFKEANISYKANWDGAYFFLLLSVMSLFT